MSVKSCSKLQGRFKVECFTKDGVKLWEENFPNGNTTVGLNYLLETGLNGGTAVTTWYCGLVDNASFTAFAAADTMGSHAGWIESDNYDEATRVEWTAGTAAGGAITNAATMDFTMNATDTIKGIFITSVSTKNGTTGTLYATGAFSSTQAVVATNVLKITYTSTLTPG